MERPLSLVQRNIRSCTSCKLAQTRRNAVPGAGADNATVAFIGEAPGYYEDRQGRPFIGEAGNVLDNELNRIGLSRESIYIMNVINCRPNNNRDPLPEELEACRPWLNSQLACLPRVKVIAALGRYASLYLCPDKPKELRNTARFTSKGKVHLFLLHPAAVLHNPQYLPDLQHGFDLLKTLLN